MNGTIRNAMQKILIAACGLWLSATKDQEPGTEGYGVLHFYINKKDFDFPDKRLENGNRIVIELSVQDRRIS